MDHGAARPTASLAVRRNRAASRGHPLRSRRGSRSRHSPRQDLPGLPPSHAAEHPRLPTRRGGSRSAAMKAVVWHGKRDVRVDEVPDPAIEEPTDVIVQVTSSGICGSDLHLYEVLAPFMEEGDVLGHEPMGIVTDVGREVERVKPGDRVVVPFNISCGHCWMCEQGLYSQCETTQVHEQDKGAALLGYTELYGQVPGGQAEALRVPQGHFGPVKVPEGPPDERFVYLSDVLPTAWQAVEYADSPAGGTVAQEAAGRLPKAAARKLVEVAGVDRLAALRSCIDATRRGGTVSISGVYGGAQNPFNMMQLFDKQLQIRMGQANVRRWIPDLMPLIEDESDPLGTEDLATHKLPLDDAPRAYRIFQRKEEGAIKVLLQPGAAA